jgi:hypothetical protein
MSLQRPVREPLLEVPQLAFSPATVKVSILDGCNTGGVVAAILQPSQRIHQILRNGLGAEYSYDPAHDGTFLEPVFESPPVALLLWWNKSRLNSKNVSWFFAPVCSPGGMPSGYRPKHPSPSYLVWSGFLRNITARNFAAQPWRISWGLLSKASASAGTSRVITLPDPM